MIIHTFPKSASSNFQPVCSCVAHGFNSLWPHQYGCPTQLSREQEFHLQEGSEPNEPHHWERWTHSIVTGPRQLQLEMVQLLGLVKSCVLPISARPTDLLPFFHWPNFTEQLNICVLEADSPSSNFGSPTHTLTGWIGAIYAILSSFH